MAEDMLGIAQAWEELLASWSVPLGAGEISTRCHGDG